MPTASLATTTVAAPDLTTYRIVHRGLRWGSRQLAAASAAFEPGDRRHGAAIARWCRGYLEELHMHHTVEDRIFFPALVERTAAAGRMIERTDAEHGEMDALIAAIEAGLPALEAGTASESLVDALRRLDTLMHDHLDFEDADLLPRFEQHFTADEYETLEEAAMKMLGISKQALFAVPFIMSMSTPEEYARIYRTAPLPFKVLIRLARPSYERRTAAAFRWRPSDGKATVSTLEVLHSPLALLARVGSLHQLVGTTVAASLAAAAHGTILLPRGRRAGATA